MSEAATTVTLGAAALAGLAGSGHCFGMCGGFAVALGLRSGAAGHSAALRDALLTHLARLSGYALAGALFGSLGAALQVAVDLQALAVALRIASGALLVLLAMRMLCALNALSWLERLGARLWSTLQPLARIAVRGGGNAGTLLLGFLWGWLPCGLVYSMLLFAALNGDALTGASIMLAFGVGTLPAMLSSSALASHVHRWLQQRGVRVASGTALLVLGLWLMSAAVGSLRHPHASTTPAPADSETSHHHTPHPNRTHTP